MMNWQRNSVYVLMLAMVLAVARMDGGAPSESTAQAVEDSPAQRLLAAWQERV